MDLPGRSRGPDQPGVRHRPGAPEHALRISTLITATGLENGRITWLRAGWPELYTELLAHLPRLAEFA